MINIPDIIAAYDRNLLTESEAKSYIQRWIETNIQERQGYTATTAARTAMEIQKIQDEDCPCCEECGCCLDDSDEEVEGVDEAMEAIEDFARWILREKK